MLDVNLGEAYAKLNEREWSTESFRFYTAVSVMSSSRIEGDARRSRRVARDHRARSGAEK